MRDAPVHAGESRFGWVLVEGDEILATRSVEEDHPGAVTKAFLHPEYGLVEPERALEISDDMMDMRKHRVICGGLRDRRRRALAPDRRQDLGDLGDVAAVRGSEHHRRRAA